MKINTLAQVLAVSVLCTTGAFAQMGQGGDNTSARTGAGSESTVNRKDEALKPAMPPKDGVMMKEGAVVVLKNGQWMTITKETEVADGLIVTSETITKDGKKVDLADGQMLTFDGNLIEAPLKTPDRANQTGQGGSVKQ